MFSFNYFIYSFQKRLNVSSLKRERHFNDTSSRSSSSLSNHVSHCGHLEDKHDSERSGDYSVCVVVAYI